MEISRSILIESPAVNSKTHQMKTKATATAKTETKATVTIEVPAKVTAIVKEIADNKAGVQALQKQGESILERGSKLIASLYDNREEASPILKAAFAAAGLTSMSDNSQKSRMLNWAFPDNEEVFNAAKAAPTIRFKNEKGDIVEKKANVNQLNAIATGNLAPNKKGVFLPVEKTGKTSKGSGGHNRQTPLDKAKAAITEAATVFCASQGKGAANAFHVLTVEILDSVSEWKFDHEEASRILSDD